MQKSNVFGDYGRYYDLLYADKDYAAEASYVIDLLQRWGDDSRTVLELGSGTGRHGRLLAEQGYEVTGMERSQQMIERAAESMAGLGHCAGGFRCVQGDVRNSFVAGSYDAVVSLFHVVSYQTENEDVAAMFQNAARHLKPEGLFLFDVWYAPAVLAQQPQVRIKRVEDDTVHLTRIAEPTLHCDRNCVQVDYTLFVREKKHDVIHSLTESHLMRYYSTSELQWIGQRQGFQLVHHEEWLTGNSPGLGTWGVCYLMSKQVGSPAP